MTIQHPPAATRPPIPAAPATDPASDAYIASGLIFQPSTHDPMRQMRMAISWSALTSEGG